jgi:DNA repair protein RecN (Recombination protein N)
VWEEIRLRSLGVIADASLALGPGLTVVTGETGAGKTMVVTAVGLLRGERADPGLVRHGDEVGRVEARVDVGHRPDVAELVADSGGELDEGVLLLARTIPAQGRSRAYAGGSAVPATQLERLGAELVAVHGQSDQHRLLRPAAQREALDRFAGAAVTDLLTAYRPAYARLGDVDRELQVLLDEATSRSRELALLQHGLAEIAAAAPQPGEDIELLAEEQRLAHADSLREAAARAHELLAGGDGALGGSWEEDTDAATRAGGARALLDGVRDHDPAVAALADRVAELSYQLADVGSELASYAASIDTDPLRLAAVQDRRALLTDLGRRYGPGVDAVLAWAEESTTRAEQLEGADERIEGLRAERAALQQTVRTLAQQLSHARREAASRLAERVSGELTALAMPHASLQVQVSSGAVDDEGTGLGPDGADEVDLQLAANAGAPARSLARSASGGELSRVMLALEVVLAATSRVATFVFDEVDAGVGGKAAVEVGRRLATLSRSAQVIVVTHLPQVAAFADRHYRVVKSDDGSVTTSGVHALDGEGRVVELSRMLAGQEESATARAHARELLDTAAARR